MLARGVALNESACRLSVPPFVCMIVLMAAYKVCIQTERVFHSWVVPGFPRSWKTLAFIMAVTACMWFLCGSLPILWRTKALRSEHYLLHSGAPADNAGMAV